MVWKISGTGTKHAVRQKVEAAAIPWNDPGRPQFDRIKAFVLAELEAAPGDWFAVSASGHIDDRGVFVNISTSSAAPRPHWPDPDEVTATGITPPMAPPAPAGE